MGNLVSMVGTSGFVSYSLGLFVGPNYFGGISMVTCGLPCGVVLRPGIDPVSLEEASLVSFILRWSLGIKARSLSLEGGSSFDLLTHFLFLLYLLWAGSSEPVSWILV